MLATALAVRDCILAAFNPTASKGGGMVLNKKNILVSLVAGDEQIEHVIPDLNEPLDKGRLSVFFYSCIYNKLKSTPNKKTTINKYKCREFIKGKRLEKHHRLCHKLPPIPGRNPIRRRKRRNPRKSRTPR